MNIAHIAAYCRRTRVAYRRFLWSFAVCTASLAGSGCSMNDVVVIPDETPEPPEVTTQVDTPSEPVVAPPPVRSSPKIVPDSAALFFDETESRKNLVIRNLGNGAGNFSLRVPEETFTTERESVTFTPASGTVAPGKTATVAVQVQRSDETCARVLRLAILETAQGTRNIGVNYSNTGRANLQIDKTATRGQYFQPNSNIIDFGSVDGNHVEFTVTNRGCVAGTLTILKSGPHEDKLVTPGEPMTVGADEHKVIRLQRPSESFFIGTHSVTLLVRQDGATVDNIVIRWAGLLR